MACYVEGAMPSKRPLVTAPSRELRRHSLGVIELGGDFRPSLYVLDPTRGSPVVCVSHDVLEAEACTFHVPEDREDALQLLVEPTELDPHTDAACDRYLIYHGKGGAARWARLEIQSAKMLGVVFDECAAANALAEHEAALCKRLNADKARVRAALLRLAEIIEDAPTVVGVDQDGLDVRTRRGIVRLEFPHTAPNVESAERMIGELLA
jgi:hypothetical protein